MKKCVLIIGVILLAASFIYADIMQPSNLLEARPDNTIRNINNPRNYPEVPDYAFDVEPISIMPSWYDYFPGAYESIPIRVQPSPAGMHPGGGIYIAFQAIPSAGAARRVYYVYIEDGEITMGPSLIDLAATAAEGFPGIDIDPETGDPFVSWHTDSPVNPAFFHCPITFDQYSLIGTPGLWNTPYTVLDNPYDIGPETDQEFIWPSVFVGPSPTPGMRRVYVVGKNYVENLSGVPCENSLIAFADFTTPTDLSTLDPDQWTHVTVPQLDDWRQDDIRPFRATIASREEGKIAIVGHAITLDEDIPPFSDAEQLFVLENDNYGEGEWTGYFGEPSIMVENPDGYFIGDSNMPYQDMRYTPYVNRHNTVIDEQGNYHFVAVFSLSTEENTWYPYFTTTKHVKFHRDTEEFTITDLYPRSENPEALYLAWDPDGDGEWEYDGEFLVTNASWPYYYHDTELVFHENYHRIVQHGSKMIALFQESVKSKLFHDGDDQYAAWASVPETYIMISGDYGEHWSEPIVLNSIDTPELADTIAAYWYISDHVEHLYDDWYRIHLFFYDQNDFGSYLQGAGPNTGGNLMYTSMDIDFSEVPLNVDDQVAVVPEGMLKQNYPNPFNPTTTINYNLPTSMEVTLEIYNVRGQLVKTLVDEVRPAGDNFVVWNGNDNSNRSVGSGVYFYKLTTDSNIETRKMLLVK
jgi:hypothetical protein